MEDYLEEAVVPVELLLEMLFQSEQVMVHIVSL